MVADLRALSEGAAAPSGARDVGEVFVNRVQTLGPLYAAYLSSVEHRLFVLQQLEQNDVFSRIRTPCPFFFGRVAFVGCYFVGCCRFFSHPPFAILTLSSRLTRPPPPCFFLVADFHLKHRVEVEGSFALAARGVERYCSFIDNLSAQVPAASPEHASLSSALGQLKVIAQRLNSKILEIDEVRSRVSFCVYRVWVCVGVGCQLSVDGAISSRFATDDELFVVCFCCFVFALPPILYPTSTHALPCCTHIVSRYIAACGSPRVPAPDEGQV